jgi:SpoVK/Ycf46/Vps4 family AAA+-type ATPase
VLAQQFEFGPAAAAGTARAAVQAAVLRREAPGWLDVWRAARDRTHAGMESLAQRVEPRNGWDDLVLPDTVAAQLVELAGQCTSRAVVYERWGFGAKLTRGRGLTALFAGPSGTGKTLAAEVLASELDLAMYRIDLAGVVSKYIGETEKNLRRVFNAAEGGGAILFFDEADALFGKRSEVRDSHDRYANIEVDYLLQRMEEYRGLAILATNRKSHIDQAFLRRLRFVIDFPLPSEELRMRIWRRAFPPDAPIEGVDWDVLARLEISGASIKSIALYAAFLAAGDGGVIGMEQLVRAAVREYSKIDRLVQPAEFGRYYAEARR